MGDIRSAVLVFRDSSDYILEPLSWFDAISFASCDERVDHRGSYSRCIAATEEIVLVSYCQWPYGILNPIVIDVPASVCYIHRQFRQSFEGVFYGSPHQRSH